MDITARFPRPSRQIHKKILTTLVLLATLVSSLGFPAGPVRAAPAITIHVNTIADANLSNNYLSLREAILLVNGGTGGDGLRTGLGRTLSANELTQVTGGTYGATGAAANIIFTTLGGSPTIALSLGTGLANESLPPVMTSGVVIDGSSGVNLPVTIDGSGAPVNTDILWLGWADGVGPTVQVSGITVRDIIISGARRYGIHINPASSSTISNCTVTGSMNYAILIQGKFGNADHNTITNCTVGGNASLGIVLNRPGANNITISNNRIGTNAAGTSAWPNTGAGLSLFKGTHHNTITGNVISGNTIQGIYLSGGDPLLPVNNNTIIDNKIGTAADGTTALPNVQGIVFDDYVLTTTIGGTAAGQANIIAFNTESGIVVTGNNTIHNQFRRNSIFKNTFLGIDLLDDKLPTDGISGGSVGPNELALRPTITKARVNGRFGIISGSASPSSTIEIFVSDSTTAAFGTGKTYCGTAIANSSGNFRFSGRMACSPGNKRLTATSTLVGGSTSEFGNNFTTTKLPLIFLPLNPK
jgi:parallel beta-helix repeat protein